MNIVIASQYIIRMEKVMKEKKTSIYNIAFMGLMTAVMCILGPLSLPIGPVPISLTNLV